MYIKLLNKKIKNINIYKNKYFNIIMFKYLFNNLLIL